MRNYLDCRFSFFRAPITNVIPHKTLSLLETFDIIRSESYNDNTTELRTIVNGKENGLYKRDHFDYVTFSGEFLRRTDKQLTLHSNLICLDIDHIQNELEFIKEELMKDKDHLIGFFTSPNGNGLKVIYPVDFFELSDQKAWYLAYTDHIQRVVGMPNLEVDEKCKDISRACFLPCDPNAYLNSQLSEGGVIPIDPKFKNSYESDEASTPSFSKNERSFAKFFGDVEVSHVDKDDDDNFKYHLIEYEKKHGLYDRPRRIWVLGAASRCRTFGMSYEVTRDNFLKFIPNHPNSFSEDDPFDLNQHLFIPVKDAFKRYANQNTAEVWENAHFETPYLDDNIFDQLPSYFTQLANELENKRERDLVFLGILVATSVLMPNVTGYYGGEEIESNLFLFISAPPASGKGKLTFSVRGVRRIQKIMKEQFEIDFQEYEYLQKLYDKGQFENKPEKPKKKKIIIPGNISSSALIKALDVNGGRGLFFETEADTITNTILQDWGSYSDLLRKVFHHESISQSRVTDDLDIEVLSPHCSVLLSGTPDQIPKLMKGIDNGLFSRFLFYHYSHEFKWQDVFANDYNEALKTGLNQLTEFAEFIYPKLIDSTGVQFEFSQSQKSEFNQILKTWTIEAIELYGEKARATVVRLGIMYFRINMIISFCRHLIDDCKWQIDPSHLIICKDVDFNITKSIVSTLKAHSLGLLSKYMKFKNLNQLKKGAQQNFYEVLPQEFKTADYRDKADNIKLSHKTAEKYISDYIQLNLLERVEHGQYRKIIGGRDS